MESNLPVDVENLPNVLEILGIITDSEHTVATVTGISKTDLQTKENIELADNKGFPSGETVFSHTFEEEVETSYNSVPVSDLKSEDSQSLTQEAPVLMDTDDSNVLRLNKIVDGNNVTVITLGEIDLHSTMCNTMETNEHQVHAAVAPVYNSDIPVHGKGGNNTEMPASTSSQSNTHDQNSELDCKDIITEESPLDNFSRNHRHGKLLQSIYVPDVGNKWYDVRGKLVTRPIDPKKLPNAFGYLPIYGRPKSKANLAEFQNEKIREFVGFDLSDQEYGNLAQYCR